MPDHFFTRIENGIIFVGESPLEKPDPADDEWRFAYSLRLLADALLNGESVSRNDRAVAGAAISHLCEITKKGKKK